MAVKKKQEDYCLKIRTLAKYKKCESGKYLVFIRAKILELFFNRQQNSTEIK